MRNLVIILLLFLVAGCKAQDTTTVYTTDGYGHRIAYSKAESIQIRAGWAAWVVKHANDSIAEVRKKATLTTLQNLYNSNVVGTDVRNLTATQQKITLGVILMKLEMVDTTFKMK